MTERIFGTDGIRGEAGTGWLQLDRVSALGRAVGRVLGRQTELRTAILGHDGRESGPSIANSLAAGLIESGFKPTFAGLITTPALAIVANLDEYGLGVMISASHNPAQDNGIKIFAAKGGKLSDELELEIEAELRANESAAKSPLKLTEDALLPERYTQYLTDHLGQSVALDGLNVALDCANGAGSRLAPGVLEKLGARVATIAAQPDGKNINRACGSTHPEALQEFVKNSDAQIGIALDGDGDRCILVDEHGELVHGDGIMTALARHAASRGDAAGKRMVATIMSNRGLHRALREVDVEVVTVGVGDRRVVEEMRRAGISLGGEQSGHIVFGDDHFFTGDGIYTALRVLSIMRETGSPLSALVAPYQPYPQILLNVPVARKPAIEELQGVEEVRSRVENELGMDGRVLLRYSGTEDLLRIMVEGPDEAQIREQASELADLVSEAIGA